MNAIKSRCFSLITNQNDRWFHFRLTMKKKRKKSIKTTLGQLTNTIRYENGSKNDQKKKESKKKMFQNWMQKKKKCLKTKLEEREKQTFIKTNLCRWCWSPCKIFFANVILLWQFFFFALSWNFYHRLSNKPFSGWRSCACNIFLLKKTKFRFRNQMQFDWITHAAGWYNQFLLLHRLD